MTKTAARIELVVLAAITFAAVSLLVTACSNSGDQVTTTSTAASSTTVSSTAASSTAVSSAAASSTTTLPASSDGSQPPIVGGSTPEEYEAALPNLEKAVEAAPDDLVALQQLAIAQYNTHRYDEAAATYEKMLKLKDDAFTRNNYANVLRDAGKTEQAKGEYLKAIGADATLTIAYLNLAVILAKEKNIDEAIRVLDRGIGATTGDDQTRLKSYKETLSASTTT
jgi:predicted negative regulator of RcsB-dependent stress response